MLRGVQFDFDKANLRPDSSVVLDEAASILSRRDDVRVRIEGYTDATGPESYNQTLSERRAESVRRYLVERGVAAERLGTAGFGDAAAWLGSRSNTPYSTSSRRGPLSPSVPSGPSAR